MVMYVFKYFTYKPPTSYIYPRVLLRLRGVEQAPKLDGRSRRRFVRQSWTGSETSNLLV
ncbi:hypothetical protein BN903_84 [Halorubrum sp. AJ67]|nr:hypothetical protein BN903_84 [Halorubrum sp. AJ67]